MTSPGLPLSEELVDLFESGVSTLVGTRNAELRPECVRAFGTRVEDDRRSLTVFLCAATSERALADIADNGLVAVTYSRPVDHRTMQVKGRAVETRPTTDAERAMQERYLASFVDQLHMIGMARAVTRRVRIAPSVAVRVAIDAVYIQTPGPTAGQPLGQGAR